MITQPTHSRARQEASFGQIAIGAAVMAGTTALAAGLLTATSPLGGAIFGVGSFLGHCLIHWISDKVGCCPDSLIFRVAQFALSTMGGISAGMLLTAVLGFQITVSAAILLTAASIAVAISTILTFGGCLCSSAIVTGIYTAST